MPGGFVQEENDSSLLLRVKLPNVRTYASLDERDIDTILRSVNSAFQAINTPVQTEVVVDTLTNGVDTVYLNVLEIEAESKLIPMQFMKIFQDFGGVYMTRCVWDVSTRTWNYEVIIYAK